MIGHINLEEQVDADYARARRRAFFGRLAAWLRGGCGRGLLPFGESGGESAGGAPVVQNRRHLGRRVVELERIVGSVGRHREFDRHFMPTKASAERWKRVDRAFHRGEELPPVPLYELRGDYYVLDGNHRVSVARYHGVQMIEAEVTEFSPRPHRSPEDTVVSDVGAAAERIGS